MLDPECYDSEMTLDEVKSLSTKEKVQIMEVLWQEFRDRFETAKVTPEQRPILDSRRERFRNGEAQVRDWDAIKDRLGRQ